MRVFIPTSPQRGAGMLLEAVLFLCFIPLTFLALLLYGQYWPRQFQARVPWTNMTGVERAVGKPLHVSTNSDGSVRWDYTRWWSGTAKVYFDTNRNFSRIFTEW